MIYGPKLSLCIIVLLSLGFDYCYSDVIKRIKRKRLGQKVKNDENFQLLDRNTFGFGIPGTNKDVNICAEDSQCEDGKHCRNWSCVSGEDGEGCNTDDDCKSNKCKGKPVLGKCLVGTVCTPGLADGESCCRDKDCDAKYCTFGKCGQNKIGEACEKDKHCDEKYCNSFGECGKHNIGEACQQSKDCIMSICDNEVCVGKKS